MGKYSYLTFDQRREIESLYNDGNRVVDIASKIQRSVAAVYEELKRGYTGEPVSYTHLDVYKRQGYAGLKALESRLFPGQGVNPPPTGR